MADINLVCIGKTKFKWVTEGVAHYAKLVKPFANFTIKEVRGIAGDMSPAELMKKEAERFRGNISKNDTVICLDRDGRRLTSEAFARWLDSMIERGASLTFVIGGQHGIDAEFKRRATASLSLSAMTFPHDLVRLVFAEQLYRALSITKGHPYHK